MRLPLTRPLQQEAARDAGAAASAAACGQHQQQQQRTKACEHLNRPL
jgi:hypothetical protein